MAEKKHLDDRDDAAFAAYIEKVSNPPKDVFFMIRFLTHSLEKSCARYRVLPNRGMGKCRELIAELEELRELGLQSSYEYQEGLAVLMAYLDFQEENGGDMDELRAEAAGVIATREEGHFGGSETLTKADLMRGTQIDFPTFAASRRSMRTYSAEDITHEEFRSVVELAELCPSACNREPWKVYYSLDRSVSAKLAEAFPAQAFLKEAYLCVITADRGLFGKEEVFQWLVNGGIFAAYLVESMHYHGIGSCICEFNLLAEAGPMVRETMGIPDNEEIIAFVGFGKYPDEARCTCAERKPVDDVAIRVG